ncbi:MAG TPA: hypothetical protein VJU15_13750, partial [Gemmatimonadales bacterium]|nr:hypothetical protein [Gemmatimonadales bacterium]
MRSKLGFSLMCLLALAACGDGATDPTDSSSINADVVSAVADGVGGDVSTMRELNFGLRHGGLFFPIGHLAQANCPWNSTTGWHVCEARDAGPVTVERQYAFYNATGSAQETYDADLTASIRVQRVEDGSMDRDTDRGSISGSVHHDRDLTVSGLAGAETQRTWNGTGHSEIAHTHVNDDRGSRSYELTADVTLADVVVPHPQNEDRDPWPLSGTITIHVVGSVTRGEETKNFERTVVITFDGTQFAQAVVNGTAGSGEFTIDLANRRL